MHLFNGIARNCKFRIPVIRENELINAYDFCCSFRLLLPYRDKFFLGIKVVSFPAVCHIYRCNVRSHQVIRIEGASAADNIVVRMRREHKNALLLQSLYLPISQVRENVYGFSDVRRKDASIDILKESRHPKYPRLRKAFFISSDSSPPASPSPSFTSNSAASQKVTG